MSPKGPVSLSPEDLLSEESGETFVGDGPPRVVLAWANRYAIGMASLGFHLVRQDLIRRGARVERAFLENWGDRSLETSRSLREADLLAFSIAFELDYPHVLEMLDRSGLEILASRRPVHAPLTLVGGVAVSV
ncbi:hypothetical protein HQ520_07845, partial [bacterium]|nr:hypothetical protein [bacterium]